MTTPSPKLSAILKRELFLALLKEMLRIRYFEEKTAELYTQGKIRSFLHLYIGEEAVAAGAIYALKPEDGIVATYREHGHALARGMLSTALEDPDPVLIFENALLYNMESELAIS